MATNERRRLRYKTDETYRQRRLRQAQEARDSQKRALAKVQRLRGWSYIDSVPDNEMVLIWDPKIFWPILAMLKNDHWECVHYDGPEPRPTHWRKPLELPLP